MIDDITREAAEFAILAHGQQMYGMRPYAYHLNNTDNVLLECGITNPDARRAAWLHDTIEDTKVTQEEVIKRFGQHVGQMVWACSGFGVNRKERNQDVYNKLKAYPPAVPVKLGDRTTNTEKAIEEAPNLIGMYGKEADTFLASIDFDHESLIGQRVIAASLKAKEIWLQAR